ncbi:MAG: MFS transporter [Lysobacterales bacterium]|jgi:MFS family permease|nr:MAG: MFS transporter [Xanthomonadales bacterium]
MRQRILPWVVAFSALLMLMISNGLVVTGITAFDEALLKEFGWSRGALKFRDLLTLLLAGAFAPFIGILIDRFRVRPLMIAGSLLLALGYLAYASIQHIGHVYLIHLVFGVVLTACGLNIAVIWVSQWFVRHRGTAIGLALVGTSLGGMLFPPVIVAMTQALGWRASFAWLALSPLLILLLGLLLGRPPSAFGVKALGADNPPPQGGSVPDPTRDLSYGEALRTVTFWALAFTAMMTFYSMLAASAHLFLHLRGLGFEPAVAAQGLSLMFGMALIGKFLFGLLADHLPQKKVFLGNIAVMFFGSLFLASLDAKLVWVAIILFGLGWGGLYTLLQLQAVNSFGLSAAGKILGTITVLDAAGGGLGIFLTGFLYDRFGSYQVPFALLSVLLFLAFLISTRIRKETKPLPT